jgi:CheY-like chemotaxis protein
VSLLENKRIFIVEDNLQNRVVFQILLNAQGALIEFDRWGRDTMSRLQGFDPVDLIILDLMLGGGVTGYNIFDQIRSFPHFAQTPIVAISAADPAIALPKTQAQGFSGFIAKPIDDTLFADQLVDILAGKPVWYAGGAMG